MWYHRAIGPEQGDGEEKSFVSGLGEKRELVLLSSEAEKDTPSTCEIDETLVCQLFSEGLAD